MTITGGAAETHKGLDYHVPKQDLMMGLQLLLEKGELKISRKGSESGALVKELVNMRQQAGVRGRIRVGAEAFGEHDDLVMAVALAVWKAKQIFAVSGMTRLPGIWGCGRGVARRGGRGPGRRWITMGCCGGEPVSSR